MPYPARKLFDAATPLRQRRLRRNEHRQSLLDGKANLAALAHELILIASQGAFAIRVDGATEGVEEGLVHEAMVRVWPGFGLKT